MLTESQIATLKLGDMIYSVFLDYEYENDPRRIKVMEGSVVGITKGEVRVELVRNGIEVRTVTFPKHALLFAYFMTKLEGLQSMRRKQLGILEDQRAGIKKRENFIKVLDEKIKSVL